MQVVTRDRKASTSYIQRRLQIGYNRAASLIERMEQEGIVGQPNHSGKREILVGGEDNEGSAWFRSLRADRRAGFSWPVGYKGTYVRGVDRTVVRPRAIWN